MTDRIDQLFDDLQSRGYAKDKTNQQFRDFMLAPGKQGYENRKQFFEDFKSQGMTDLETYEDFASLLGLHAGTPERRSTPTYQPTANEMAGFQSTINSAGRTAANPTQSYERKAGLMEKRQGLNVPQRVNLGESNNLTPTEQHLNPETGELEQGYMTESGNEYDNKAIADMEQRELDRQRWEREHPEESLMGQIDNRIANLEEEIRKREDIEGIPTGFGTTLYQSGLGAPYRPDKQQKSYDDMRMALRDLQDAKTMLERNKQLHASSDFLGGVGIPFTKDWFNNWKNFGYGVWDALHDVSMYDFGVSEMSKAGTYMRIKNKMERGEELTDQETDIALAGMALAQAQQLADLPHGYTAGVTTTEMVPFMAQMAANPASGVGKAFARKAVRKFGRDGLKAVTARVAARVAGNIGEAAVLSNTWQAGKTAADIVQRNTGGQFAYDEDGNIIMGHYERGDNDEENFVEGGKGIGQSIWEGEAASIIENFTELGFGGSINGMLSKVAGSKLGKKIGLSYISDLVGKVGSTPFARNLKRFMERTHWDGMIEEPLEEEYGIILNSLLTGDNQFSDLIDSKQQADIFAGTMWFGGMMAAMNTAAYPFAKRAMKRNLNNADVQGEMAFHDEWPTMKAAIDNMDDKQIVDLLYGIKDDDKFNNEQKAAMFGYAARLKQYQGANVADMLMRMEDNLGQNEASIKGAYDEGTEAQTPDEMKEFVDEATAAGENLTQYGKEFTAMIANGSADPSKTLDYLMNNRDIYDDEQIAAAADYYQKQARAQGVMDAALDKVDLEVEKANAEVVSNTHKATGNVIMAKGDGDMDYYIIAGDPDVGTGGAVVVKNAATGELSVKSPEELMIYSMKNAEELIQQNETVLRPQLEQQADDDITYGSPANEVFDLEDTVTLQDGDGGVIEGQIVSLPNAVDGVFVVQTNDGRALQMTADDMNRRIVGHNGAEVVRAAATPQQSEQTAGEPAGTVNTTAAGTVATEEEQSGNLDNAGGEAGAENGTGADNPPATALSRIPVRTDTKGNPLKGKSGRPILDWHKASVEDAAAALIETTGGDMVMARDTASDLVKNEQARLEKIRKQKPKGDDPIEIAESRVAIRQQEQEQQAIIKQWQDVNQLIQRQMREEQQRVEAEREAAKSEEQRQREAEEARIRKEKQDEIERQRIREQIEKDRERRTKEYEPVVKAREEMAGDAEALSVLNDTEPRSLEEWVSSLLNPHSMLWQDASESERGLQSELGLKRADMQRFIQLLGTKESGAKPFGKVVLDIYESLPEGIKNQTTDEDVRRVVLDMFRSMENSTQMMHLTEQNRIDEAREMLRENLRREQEAEMDAWAESYHLTPEERDTFDEWLQVPPTDIEADVINQIIADNEQNRTSPSVGGEPVSGTDAAGVEGGESQVQQEGETAGNGVYEETVAEGTEADSGEPAAADYDVAGRAPGAIAPSEQLKYSKRLLTKEDATELMQRMEDAAVDDPQISLTPESWASTFGLGNSLETPIGNVKMGEGQYQKFLDKARSSEFGMAVQTLQDPDVVLIEPSQAIEGQTTERPYSYIFVKTFIRDGQKMKYFASVTVQRDKMEVSVSSHIMKPSKVLERLMRLERLYTKETLLPNSSEWHLAEQQNAVPDLLPTQGNNVTSEGKGTEKSANLQENPQNSSELGKTSTPEENTNEHKTTGELKPQTVKDNALRDALIELMRKAGIEVSDDWELGQRVLDEFNGRLTDDVKQMGSRVDSKKQQLSDELGQRELSDTQQTVVDVFTGKSDNKPITVNRGGKEFTVKMRQGNERGAGTKHSLFRHYGTGVGVITADDIMHIPDVLADGERTEKQQGNVKLAVYKMTDESGKRYTVVTELKKSGEVFNDFYTNKKASNQTPQMPNGDTLESARTNDLNASSGAKVLQNPETAKDSEGKIRQQKAERPVFVSNAANAVENIKQEKATPEQWLKMIEKAGGLKAGEDKWIGLSDWLKSQDKKSLTKQEVMDFIRNNQIEVEEVNYEEYNGENNDPIPRHIYSTRLRYTTNGLQNKKEIALVVPGIEPYNESDQIHFGDAGNGRAVAWVRFGETMDADGNRVLVIDEIQSKRHQDARENGYRTKEFDQIDSRIKELEGKEQMTPEEQKEYRDLMEKMGDMLKENPHPVPDAPFEKNWHELAMKRMLRYAAENGYDKIAWTKGAQQAERYDIGGTADYIDAGISVDGERWTDIHLNGGGKAEILHDDEGNVIRIGGSRGHLLNQMNPKKLSEVIGKELAVKILAQTERGSDNIVKYEGKDLRIGGEGMKGFYDQMLPRFMDKYGKKWGVKTGEVELPQLEESARKMWGVDVTPDMKESVMEGQPMFFKTSDGQAYGYTYQGKIYIDPRIATAETPIHEYGHLWAEMKRQTAPEEWEQMKKVMLTDKLVQPIIDWVKRDYPELAKEGREDDFIEEIITQFSGKRGAERLREVAEEVARENGGVFGKAEAVTAMQRLKNILNRFWEGVARMMGWKYTNANQIADRMMADMLNGVNPRERMTNVSKGIKSQQDILFQKMPKHEPFKLSEEKKDAEGNRMYERNGSTDLWSASSLLSKAKRQQAPVRLSERNMKHIISNHSDKLDSEEKVFDFLDNVFANATKLRRARGRGMFVVVENDNTDSVAMIKLMPSEDGDYYNIDTAGYYRKSKWKDSEEVIADLSEPGQSDAVADASKPQVPDENGGELINAEAQVPSSGGKDTKNINTLQENGQENAEILREGEAITIPIQGNRKLTAKQQRDRQAFAERQWRRAHERADEWIKKLNLGNEVTVVDSIKELPGYESFSERKKRAKGWFDKDTGKIVIVMGNHRSPMDVVSTILHEGVGHHGLRKLFGENFDTFLDNAYNSAESDIQKEIDAMTEKYDGDRRKATEEYLARLAEDTDFERAENSGWWKKIQRWFTEMLRNLGLTDGLPSYEVISDNELRYILWRSYENLAEPGRYRNVFQTAKDISMQSKLRTGNYAKTIQMPVKGRIEDEVPKMVMNHQDEIDIRKRVSEMSLDEAKAAYRRIDDSMRDENGLDIDDHSEKVKKDWIEKNGLQGVGKAMADDLQALMDKYGSGMIELRWELQDRIEELGGSYAREDEAEVKDVDIEEVNRTFNEQLQQQIDGTLPKGHVYEMGMPSKYLQSTGVPNLPIRLQASVLNRKSNDPLHRYSLEEVKDLVKLIQKPIAIFSYGDKDKAQNLMVGIAQNTEEGKQFLVGLSMNPSVNGRELEINSVRNVFPKNFHDWIHWINQGKMLRVDDKKQIEDIIDALRINPVDYISDNDLNSAAKIVKSFDNPKLLEENISEEEENELFREGDDMTDVALEQYETMAASKRLEFQEAWQDSMISLKAIQDAIAAESGKKATGAEDAYNFENRMHGRAKNMAEKYDWQFYRPMLETFNDFIKARGLTQEQGIEYLVAKSGLERNVYYAFRDAAKSKVKDDVSEERDRLEKDYARGRISEDDYKATKADLEEREQTGFEELMQRIREMYAYQHAKEEYDAGNISYSEYLRIIETTIRGQLKRKKPKEDADGNIVSDNYYDDYAQDYSGLTETFAKEQYDEAQAVKKQYDRTIDKDEKKKLWAEYSKLMRQAYESARLVAEDAVFAGEPSGETESAARNLWEKINAATKETLKHSYESGLIDRKNYYKVRDMFNWYIPLRGWDEDRAADVYTYMGKENVFSPAVKKTWGRKSKAENPLAYIGNIAVSTILSGHRNLMKQHFLNYVLNNPTNLVSISESWYENIAPDGESPVWVLRSADTAGKNPDEIAQIINDFNEEMLQKQRDGKAMPVRGRLRLDVHATSGQKSEHVVEVQRAGRTYQLYINGNPKAAQALNGTNMEESKLRLREVIRNLNRSMAAFFTSKNPAFVVSNLSRDLNMAGASVAINEGNAYNKKFVENVVKVLVPRMGESSKWVPASKQPTGLMPSLMRKWKSDTLDMNDETERYFKEFMDEGGETGFVNMLSVDSFKEKMQKEIAQMNGSSLFGKNVKETTIGKALRLMGETFEFYNRCAEDATRFIVYMTSRQMGKTLEESIADAKNVTLNFNRKGTGGKGSDRMPFSQRDVQDLFIFVNPAIQALANMYRMGKGHPLKFGIVTAGFVAGGLIMPVVNQWLLNMFGDDDDKQAYWNLPPWIRKNNLVFWIPFTKHFLTIPLAQEFRVFYGVGEMIASGRMEHPHQNMGVEIFESVADLVPINPTGNGGNLIIDFAPTMTQPVLQIAFNTDFTGKPIWKDNQGNKYAPAFSKAYASTPKWMTKISEGLNSVTGGDEDERGWLEKNKTGAYANNPAVWNHLLQGYLGGMYNTIAKSIDVVGTTGSWALGSGDAPKVYQMPVVNRFLNSPAERDNSGALGEDYWELVEESNEYHDILSARKNKTKNGDAKAKEKLERMLQSEDYHRILVIDEYKKMIDATRKEKERTDNQEMRKTYNDSISELKDDLLEELAEIDGGRDAVGLAMKKFDESEDPKRRKQIATRISKEAGASKDSYGEKAESDHAYQYQIQRTAQDVWEDALLYALQEQLRDEGKEKEKNALSNERQKVHYPDGTGKSAIKLHGGNSDREIMKRIRKNRSKLLEKYGLDKKMPPEKDESKQ